MNSFCGIERIFTLRNNRNVSHSFSLNLSPGHTDWQKTKSQREREALLLEELVKIVDKRNELVQSQDNQEKAYVFIDYSAKLLLTDRL